MPLEELLVHGHGLHRMDALVEVKLLHPVNQQQRIAVRQGLQHLVDVIVRDRRSCACFVGHALPPYACLATSRRLLRLLALLCGLLLLDQLRGDQRLLDFLEQLRGVAGRAPIGGRHDRD